VIISTGTLTANDKFLIGRSTNGSTCWQLGCRKKKLNIIWRASTSSSLLTDNRPKRNACWFSSQLFVSLSLISAYVAVPPLGVPIGSLYSPPSPRSCAPVSGYDDRQVPIDWAHSSPLASGFDLPLAICKLPYFPHAHIGVHDNIRTVIGKSSSLDISRCLHTRANGFRCLPYPVATHFFVINPRNFDVDVNSVKQRTEDSFLIFGNDSRRTRTRFLCF